MLGFIEAAIVALAVILALRFGLKIARVEACRERLRGQHADAFFAAAENLVKDQDTPPELLEVLDSLNETLSDPGAAKFLMSWFARGKQIEAERPAVLNKVAREFFAKRPELEPSWHKALAQWFLALSYISFWRGPLLRAAMNDHELLGAAKSIKNNALPPQTVIARDNRVAA